MADDLTAVSSEPASSAAPAGAAVSSSPSADTGSLDTAAITAQVFSEAKGDTQAAPPSADPSATPPTPVAATSDDEADAEYQTLLASGSMPVDRHKAVLTNARNKTRAEVEREYRERYGWADQIDRARAEHALGLMQALDRNPEQTLRTIAGAMGINFAPPAAPKEPEGPPPPDVRLDDGSEFYSAAQLAKLNAWKDAQLEQRFAALSKRFEPWVQKQVHAEMRQQADAEAGSLLTTCRNEWPQFSALEGDIKQRMMADPQLSLDRAYIQAFASKGLPALQAQHETDRASQLSRKAAASAAPPSAPRAVTPLRDRERTTEDLTREVFAAARR